MAKNSQTFRKRQREIKLREKAQLKRERREQRGKEKKDLLALDAQPVSDQVSAASAEPIAGDEHRVLEEGAKVSENPQ